MVQTFLLAIAGHGELSYIYSALGEKLAKKMKNNTYQYYARNRVYNNDKSLNYLLFDEGLVNKSSGAYIYEYHMKDHLGNTRVTFQPNWSGTTTTQVAEYYPFGSSYLPVSPAGTNKYLYNGKEKQNDVLSGTALDWYDYGARFYDPTIGRWHTPDPRAEKYYRWSPYTYCKDNPMKFIDPQGDTTRVYTESSTNLGAGHAWISVGEGKNRTLYSYGRYSGTYKSMLPSTLRNGPGVLVRLQGKDAEKYINDKLSNTKVSSFKVMDVTDEKTGKVLDAKFNASSKLPTQREYKNDPRAHVIGEYKLLSNNCATFVSNTLNEAGSEALENMSNPKTGEQSQNSFIIPSSLGSFLNWQSNSWLGNHSVVEENEDE